MKKLPPRPPKKAFDSTHRPVVGIAFTQGLARLEKMRQGIVDYAKEHGGWTFLFKPEIIGPSIDWLKHAHADGAFVFMLTPKDRQVARALAMPVVNLGAHIAPGTIPSVLTDNRRIGRMAAEYFLGLGFRQLGFYGANTWYGRERRAGFADAARQAGAECKSLIESVSSSSPEQQRRLEHWLRELRPPVGIMASIDMRAAMVVDACARTGLRVPDEVAVMGVDNDQFVCEQGLVPLTSIVRNEWKLGWEAAAMLDGLMAGAKPPRKPVFVEPVRVEARKSTSTLPVTDPFLARLVAEARANLDKPFGVEWLMARGNCSRRWLEMRFHATLGRTPLEVLNLMRVGRARDLLGDASLSLSDIARQCGFTDSRRFRLVFNKHMGATPRQYRRDRLRAPAVAIE